MKIKLYDKMMDLMAREFYHTVGSRCREILGAKNELNYFSNRLRQCQKTGMMRVEVSMFFDKDFGFKLRDCHLTF